MKKGRKEVRLRSNLVIIYLWDIEAGRSRRIAFGKMDKLYDFFVENSRVMNDRLQKISGEYKSNEELKEKISEVVGGDEFIHGHGSFEDEASIELRYSIEEEERG